MVDVKESKELESLKKELESVKAENAGLKKQMQDNSAGVHQILSQLEAHKGELADTRIISIQLRARLILAEKSNVDLQQLVQSLQARIAELEKPAEKK